MLAANRNLIVWLFVVGVVCSSGINWFSYFPSSEVDLVGKESASVQLRRKWSIPLALGQRKLLALDNVLVYLDKIMGRISDNESCNYKGSLPVYSTSFFGDGFCSQFQSLTKSMMYGLHYTNYSIPVLPKGPLVGYSVSERCDFTQRSLHCYFQYFSPCQRQWQESNGNIENLDGSKYRTGLFDETIIPTDFRQFDTSFWWGAMQFYILSFLHPRIDSNFILKEALEELYPGGIGVAPTSILAPVPRIGIHIHRGPHPEKPDFSMSTHPFHGIVEAMETMLESTQCQIHNQHTCFVEINFFEDNYSHRSGNIPGNNWAMDDLRVHMYRVYSWLRAAVKHDTQIVERNKTDLFHRRNGRGQPAGVLVKNEDVKRAITLYEQSCPIVEAIDAPHETKDLSQCGFPVDNEWMKEKNLQWLIPLQVLVVSDDANVLQIARNVYHTYTFNAGFSQMWESLGAAGQLKKNTANLLFEHPIRATLEILRDVYYLSTCSTLIGTASSQVFRMAVALSNVSAVLQDAIVMDIHELAAIRNATEIISLPMPEVFRGASIAGKVFDESTAKAKMKAAKLAPNHRSNHNHPGSEVKPKASNKPAPGLHHPPVSTQAIVSHNISPKRTATPPAKSSTRPSP